MTVADEDKKDPADKTRVDVVPPRPPVLPPAGAPPAVGASPAVGGSPAVEDAPSGDATQLLKVPTPPPPLRPPAAGAPVKVVAPGAPPPKSEGPATVAAPSRPPAAPAPTAPPPAPPAAPAPPRSAEPGAVRAAQPAMEEEGRTVVLATSQRIPARLQRLKPAGRSEVVTLHGTHYLLGRGTSADIRLYSETASREHARLHCRDGQWYLEPMRGKVVVVNGTNVREEIALTHKTRLEFGGDEVSFLDEATDVTPRAATRGDMRRTWAIALIVAGLVVVALWLFMRR